MNSRRLDDALRACARGIHSLEAGAGLLIDCGSWLHREDFTSRCITTGTSISDGVAPTRIFGKARIVIAVEPEPGCGLADGLFQGEFQRVPVVIGERGEETIVGAWAATPGREDGLGRLREALRQPGIAVVVAHPG